MRAIPRAAVLAILALALAAAPAAAEPRPDPGFGPIAFPGFKFGFVVVQGGGTHQLDAAGKLATASGAGTVTNFPYLGDGTYEYDVTQPPPDICSSCGLLGSFTVTSPLGSVEFPFIGCALTVNGGYCQLNANWGGGEFGPPVGTGAAAGVKGFATMHLKWSSIRGGHLESGFIVPVLTK